MPKDIRVLLIPADADKPLEIKTINPTDLNAMQALVGGYLESIELSNPPAWLMVNEDGHSRELPPNPRATDIVVTHARAMIAGRHILGDCFITGPVDDDFWQTDVPDFWGSEEPVVEIDISEMFPPEDRERLSPRPDETPGEWAARLQREIEPDE